jgi:hypothetical protein
LRTSSTLWCALLGVACVDQTPVTPRENIVLVQAVLDAAVSHQTVIVQTTTGALNQQTDVKGARVTVAAPDGRTTVAAEVVDTIPPSFQGARPVFTTSYRLSFADIGGVVAGGRYVLHIVLPDGREVNGVTTVPSASGRPTPSALPNFDRTRDTLSLTWRSALGAAAYQVFISAQTTFSVFADTAITIPGKAENEDGNPAFWPGQTNRIAVNAVDANYYDYYRRTSDIFSGRGIISHLDGAIGVFGSIAPVASYTIVVR